MSDDELVRLLEAVMTMVMTPYPWPTDASANDDRLVFALGQIAGIASKAINERRGKPS